jgi:histidyl-tRNA synthetase
MSEREMFPSDLPIFGPDVLIAANGEDLAPRALSLAQAIREENPQLRVMVYPQPSDKFQKQKAYCRARRIPILVALEAELTWVNGEQADLTQVPAVVRDMIPSTKEILKREVEQERRIARDMRNAINSGLWETSESGEQ